MLDDKHSVQNPNNKNAIALMLGDKHECGSSRPEASRPESSRPGPI